MKPCYKIVCTVSAGAIIGALAGWYSAGDITSAPKSPLVPNSGSKPLRNPSIFDGNLDARAGRPDSMRDIVDAYGDALSGRRDSVWVPDDIFDRYNCASIVDYSTGGEINLDERFLEGIGFSKEQIEALKDALQNCAKEMLEIERNNLQVITDEEQGIVSLEFPVLDGVFAGLFEEEISKALGDGYAPLPGWLSAWLKKSLRSALDGGAEIPKKIISTARDNGDIEYKIWIGNQSIVYVDKSGAEGTVPRPWLGEFISHTKPGG